MVSPSRKEKEDLNIPAQTPGVQAMVPIMVNIQPHVTEQASFPRNDNSISSDNHSIPTDLPPFDKQKLLAMQAQILQGRLQPNVVSPHDMEVTRAEVPTGPAKRQVAEAWNNGKRKRNTLSVSVKKIGAIWWRYLWQV